jgi:Serpin (serine protease inhibitor)
MRSRSVGSGRRPVLLAAALVVATLLGAGVPWTLSAVRGDRPLSSGAERTGQPGSDVAVGARHGAGYELVAGAGRSGRADPAAAGPAAAAERRFALRLLRRLGRSDTAVSPAGVAVTLVMLQNGARGATGAEIRRVLAVGGMPGRRVNIGWAALADSWSAAARADGVTLRSANAVWTQSGLEVRSRFVATLTRWFHSGVWQADFAADRTAAVAAVNAWTSARTHGRIRTLFADLPTDTRAVLADAVYFSADWVRGFGPGREASPHRTGRRAPGSCR